MSKQSYDPIAALNRENKWRTIKPLVMPVVWTMCISPVLIILIYLCVLFGEFIDWAFTNYWIQSGFFLVIVSFALIVRWVVKNTWG